MISRTAVACFATLWLAASLPASDEVAPRPWEHQSSDIAPDPLIHFGALENGIRYAWRKNAEPKERVCVWLHVDVGSLSEEESERGMAHFLEHMAFNGSENFPAGTLIQWLQQRGLQFGADSNAHTAFSETVYTLDLPNAGEKSVREGLLVLSDMAARLTLSQTEVDAEKGVIDGEQRERDSAPARLGMKTLEEYFAGARLAERIPIGLKPARDAFSAESVRKFYSKWYRPDQLTVIIVGDLRELDPVPLVKEAFGALPAPEGPRPLEPSPGKPRYDKPYYNLHEAEIPIVQLVLGRYGPWRDTPFDRKTVVEDLPIRVASAMLSRRFAKMAKAGKAPFLQAAADFDELPGVTRGPSLQVIAEPAKWQDAYRTAELELRAAIQHGFQEEELRIQRADRLRALDEAVRREHTLASGALAQQIANAAEERYIPATASTMRDIVKPAVDALTVESCRKALETAWSEGVLGLQCLGNVDLGPDAAKILEDLHAANQKIEPPAPEKISEAKFAYASDPARAGKIASRKDLEPGIVDVVFENGVRALVKRTDFKEREVQLALAIGEGELSSPIDAAALRFVTDEAIGGAGLAAHDVEQLRGLLAGKAVSVGFGVSDSAFMISGGTTNDDLLFALELACAMVEHPGWRTDGLDRFQREVKQHFELLSHSIDGPFGLEFERKLYGNDPRFGLPSLAEIEAIDITAVRKWIEPILADAPMQIALVGDIDVEKAIEGVARTLGTLPKRRARAVDPARLVTPTLSAGKTLEAEIETTIPSALVLGLFQAGDGIDAARRRDLHFLARILQDRVLNEVREKLGASYSPAAYDELSPTYPGMGRFVIRAQGEPAHVDALSKAVVAVGSSLAKGITAEEVSRLREPLLKELRDQLRKNRFWLMTLQRLFVRPDAIEDALSAETYYAALEAEHLTEVAKQYFAPEKASVVIVKPKDAAGSAAGADPKKGNR